MQPKFKDVSKAEWLAKVEKDLKGKSLESLDFEVEGGTFSPFHHREDLPSQPSPLGTSVSWKIGREFPFRGIESTNKDILRALNHGVSSIYITGDHEEYLKDGILAAVLKDVILDLVEVFYDAQGNRVLQYDGSTRFLDREDYFSSQFYALGAIDAPYSNDLFLAYCEYIRRAPFSPVFHVFTNDSFYDTIAGFRALRLCWSLLSKSCGKQTECKIVAHRIIKEGSDENLNRIADTTHAVAAVIGGADTILISPGDKDIGTDFSTRIATNVHHLLRYEAHLNKVSDPASGSYFLENLTEHYAKKIWHYFQTDPRHGTLSSTPDL